jgi:hypothetical protein
MNAARRPTSLATTGAVRRKARGRGLVLRRKAVGTPTAGRPPALAWAGDVAFNSTAGERPLFCMPRYLYAACPELAEGPVLSLSKESHARF